MSKLGSYLKELRGTLSYKDVYRETGISTGLLHAYETGQKLPSTTRLLALADYYETTYEELRLKYYEDIFSDPRERAIARRFFQENP